MAGQSPDLSQISRTAAHGERRHGEERSAVFGTHHSISEAHLPRYLAEWDFKWNTRNITDGERAALALKGTEGRRLTYRPTNEARN
jgi:hypothetical protein